jgi:hypothetical protein
MSPKSVPVLLWISLVFPSTFVVQKYLGWNGVVAYSGCVAVALALAPRVFQRLSRRNVTWLAMATFALVVALFVTTYPIANAHVPGTGSDDDDAYNVGVTALFSAASPYARTTYLGNVLHQFPGSFLLAAPFVLLNTSALQNLFWLPMFFLAVRREAGNDRTALHLAWLVIALSPTALHQVVTGTGHVSNTIYVLLGLWWLVRTNHRDAAAIGWGVALASRANFLFLIPLAFGWLSQHHGWRVALRAMALTSATVVSLTLPFFLHDPAHFGPLEAADRLLRFDALIPHAGAGLMALMASLAIGLALRPMDTGELFLNCALVQAFPVVAGLVLSSLHEGRFDMAYAAYGTFFAWFVFMAVVARISQEAVSDKGFGLPTRGRDSGQVRAMTFG